MLNSIEYVYMIYKERSFTKAAEKLYVSQPDTGEQALDITDALVRSSAVDIIVIDSVAALVPKKEIEAKVNEMSLIVMSDSEVKEMSELDLVAFVSDGSSYFNTTMEVIKNENPDVRFKIIQDNTELLDSLYNKEIDALLMREAHCSTYEEVYKLFSIETKKIWNHLITEEITDISKDVNVVNTTFMYKTASSLVGVDLATFETFKINIPYAVVAPLESGLTMDIGDKVAEQQ